MEKPTCKIVGCDHGGPVSRGWCKPHYDSWLRHGDPTVRYHVKYSTPEERFACTVERRGECEVWTGSTNRKGYGVIWDGSRDVGVHRYAWERINGLIPDGMQIDHICHNPACVNVEHLRPVTREQNARYRSGATRSSKSGARNVYLRPTGNYQVQIRKHGEIHSFGTYQTVEEAALVAERARKELFGEFAGKG